MIAPINPPTENCLVVINPFNNLSNEFSARISLSSLKTVKDIYFQVEKQLNAPEWIWQRYELSLKINDKDHIVLEQTNSLSSYKLNGQVKKIKKIE